MKILSACRTSSLTATVWGDWKRAWPWMTVQFFCPRSHSSTPLFDRPETSSLRAFTRFMSTRTSPLIAKPYSAPRRTTWAAYALATKRALPPDVDRLVVGWPDEVAEEIGLGPNDAVAVLSHDVKFDEPAIIEALRRGCRYVGAVGSKKTQADRKCPPPRGRGKRGGPRAVAGPGRAGSSVDVLRLRRRWRSWPRSSPSDTADRACRCGSGPSSRARA